MNQPEQVTGWLIEWRNGDPSALEKLTTALYDELHRLASAYMRRENPGHTLQPTALIHEAYLRLVNQPQADWQNRAHFVGVAARIMRQVLVDRARAKRASKRGGGRQVPLTEKLALSKGRDIDLLALDELLSQLAVFDARKARVIELRYFGGLLTDEIAQALGISVATVGRELRLAQAWLYRELKD